MKRRIIIIIMFFTVICSYYIFNFTQHSYQLAIQFFPENPHVQFVDYGSKLEMSKENNVDVLLAKTWSKTNQETNLRQDVNLLFKNGMLIAKSYPWKENSDSIFSKFERSIAMENSIYTIVSYHYAEIHDKDIITSKQVISFDKLYVTYFQNTIEAFKEAQNVRQEEVVEKLKSTYSNQRNSLLEKGIYELNINQSNYDIYDLDTFSIKNDHGGTISKDQSKNALNKLWQGVYKYYISDDKGNENILPPMPWVLLDKKGTHILVLFQRANGNFEKLLLQL